MKVFVCFLAVVGFACAAHPLSDEFIQELNEHATTWKAGRNFHEDSGNYVKGLMGAWIVPGLPRLPTLDAPVAENLPEEFDARTQWPDCPSIGEIRDQSSCGSCWAISAAEIMTDRQCIHKNETFHYSTNDIMSCCKSCGDGCNGGYPFMAMEYWRRDGVVSGGQYGTKEGCQPYPFVKCEHHVSGDKESCEKLHFKTPSCKKTCEAGYDKKFSEDKKFAKSAYTVHSNEDKIMTEIQTNGPVQGAFTVYSDFPNYKSGVYQHTKGSALGGHAIRILGWGVEDGTKYWLVANSWNEDWGDKGYFKILRGSDECGIESGIVAGIPK